MYVRVYAPDGEMFEVTRDRADRLILQDGWTQTRPEPAKAAVEETESSEEVRPVSKSRKLRTSSEDV